MYSLFLKRCSGSLRLRHSTSANTHSGGRLCVCKFSQRREQFISHRIMNPLRCCSRGAGRSRGCRAGSWLHCRRAGSLRTAARRRTSGGGILPPPSPPPWQPAAPSHSAAQRAAYTEAHQRTHTRPSGQKTDDKTHTGGKYK